MEKLKVILDTDIGHDMDDACALAYLCARPDVDLLGVTTVGGDAWSRAELVSAVCTSMHKPDVPIFPGLETCILRHQYQDHNPQSFVLEKYPHRSDFPPRKAITWRSETIRQNPGEVVLFAIGPLNNISILFQMDPEIPSLLKAFYWMGGKFAEYDYPTFTKKVNDNVISTATTGNLMEWNAAIDGLSTAIVFEKDIKTFRSVGIDITHRVCLTAKEFKERLKEKLPPILSDLSDAWLDFDPTDSRVLTYHDPVCVTSFFNDKICEYTRGNVTVETISPKLRGFTYFEIDPEGRHEIATDVDVEAFFEEFGNTVEKAK